MANLATMIMEGTTFSQNGSSIDTSKYDFSKEATMESDFANSAVVALYSDIMEAEKAYMAADVIVAAQGIQAKSVNESFDMKPVVEGMIKDFFSKIVEGLKKFWAKIKEWFKKVYEWFRMIFSNAKEFAKRYGKELRNKKYDGFKWEGHEWTLKDGNSECDKWVSGFESQLGKLSPKVSELSEKVKDGAAPGSQSGSSPKPNQNPPSDGEATSEPEGTRVTYGKERYVVIDGKWSLAESTLPLFENYDSDGIKTWLLSSSDVKFEEGKSSSDCIDEYIKFVTKAADSSEMRSNLEEKYRAGSVEKSTITDFDCGEFKNPGEVIDFLDKGDKLISDFEKSRKSIEKPIEQLIKAIDKIKVDEKDTTKNGIITSNISYISSIYTGVLNAIKSCIDVKIAAHKAALSELLGAMKRFYSFKSATESMDIYDVESLGVLESISVVTESDDENDSDTKSSKKSKDSEDDDGESKGKDDDSDEEEASESVKHILEMAHSFSF